MEGVDSVPPPARHTADITDKRLLRGAKTRATVLRQAVDIASLDGLSGLSFGRLATETGLSKAGIQTLFRTKEALQLAAIDYARDWFTEAVVEPARSASHGVARLRALVDHWMAYAETPLFAGGCFRVATMAEHDSKPGPVRDALFRDQRAWVRLLERELRAAVSAGEIADLDTDLVAFQIDAVLCATNTALRIGDPEASARARRIIEGFLKPA
ncbi:TetR/AcrR family transcriptional regulator [Nocardia sp. NBC_00508]|uniref:TetR/AcrR family transcriptional regulator n=1 Tax=Nocardia sp. NBC_00508 TaxID=2975992 RepID=UPI002E80BEB4|nr:TetR/AcrR family transcriptional regulator [Nocardia sp. NBC_00508]WUD68104.1 TetR/AcrR family transcriptional regulator [Nocardia sp. NBC_00508]